LLLHLYKYRSVTREEENRKSKFKLNIGVPFTIISTDVYLNMPFSFAMPQPWLNSWRQHELASIIQRGFKLTYRNYRIKVKINISYVYIDSIIWYWYISVLIGTTYLIPIWNEDASCTAMARDPRSLRHLSPSLALRNVEM
jgi:hypothetical protein